MDKTPLAMLTPGMHLASGQTVRTVSGRTTTPFPRVDFSTKGRSQKTVRQVDRWLMGNALDEALARRDWFNARQFAHYLDRPSQSDKDSAELYLTTTPARP